MAFMAFLTTTGSLCFGGSMPECRGDGDGGWGGLGGTHSPHPISDTVTRTHYMSCLGLL